MMTMILPVLLMLAQDALKGDYGADRANNDVLFYHLDVRVDPVKQLISGKNTVRFRMLADGTRIQLDLTQKLNIDKIVWHNGEALKYERDQRAVLIDFPSTLRKGKTYSIDFHYSGNPVETGRFGGLAFKKDANGNPWINTACEGPGASIWWPNKDQWRDEVDEMKISVAIPNELVDVSNGKFLGKTDLGDGYTRWDWHVQYPINNYSVSLNIGKYVHFGERHGRTAMDYWVLPEHLEKARVQFAQTRGMMDAFEHYFGEYPFVKDGYKLIDVPYSGMEHQSAVTYGNRFANGYLERDWTGVGISLKFDFIIIHESGHEWFGNAVSAADRSDMWIQEGWCTYMEALYVEHRWGKADALRYLNGYKPKVRNQEPIITARGVNGNAPIDQYFKGALFLNTLRSIVNDDAKWFALIRGFYQKYKYKNIMTEDVVAYFNSKTGTDLTAVFDAYLRQAKPPAVDLRTGEFRWNGPMAIRVGSEVVQPSAEWKKSPLTKADFDKASELYYFTVAVLPPGDL